MTCSQKFLAQEKGSFKPLSCVRESAPLLTKSSEAMGVFYNSTPLLGKCGGGRGANRM